MGETPCMLGEWLMQKDSGCGDALYSVTVP